MGRATSLRQLFGLPSRSLGARITLMFLALILVVQWAGFATIRTAIRSNAKSAVAEQLTLGQRVYSHLIEQSANQLVQGAKVLAADYGFREAIGTHDRETIASALGNHGARLGATISLFKPADGSATIAGDGAESPLADADVDGLFRKATVSGHSVDNQAQGDHLYQMVTLPVRAPNLLGYVVMGFSVEAGIARRVWDLSGLHVSFLVRQSDHHWRVLNSTLQNATALSLSGALDDSAGQTVTLGQEDFRIQALPVKVLGGQEVIAVLQRSLQEAMAPFDRLQFFLLLLTLAGLVVSALGSLFTARRITRPVRSLVDSVRRFGAGDYDAPVAVHGDDEIADLATAFNLMRSEIGEREQRISRLAFRDQLTELPNRAQFAIDLEEAIETCRQSLMPCHMLIIDLARFKHVNDVLGHTFGDALLCDVARRFTRGADPRARSLARLAGDEFALIVSKVPVEVAIEVAQATALLLTTPFRLQQQTIDLSAGIGIASFPQHANNAQNLMAKAEVAMYAAKRNRLPMAVFDPTMDRSSQDNLSMAGELRRAMQNDELTLYFQPKISLRDGRVTGVETLVRWVHPERGFVGPDNFIPFAEQTGLITEMTHWILGRAARQVKLWRRAGITLQVAVNLSTRDLLDHDFAGRVLATVQEQQCSPRDFCLEITESAIMEDAARALSTLDKLHAMGFRLSIDDFGTGYSSLAYLKRLPVDEIKIDRSFVMNMQEDRDDEIIVQSTVNLGHSLGLQVVAEGVENEAVWHRLAAAGCDYGQGYFMCRPVPADKLAGWLSDWVAPAGESAPKGQRRERVLVDA